MKHSNERSSGGRFSLVFVSLSLAASTACARGAAGPSVTAAARGQAFASGGAQAVAVAAGRAPARQTVAQASTRTTAPARDEGPRLEGSARREQVQNVAYRSGVANSCWNDAVAHLPQHRPERVSARLQVNEQGRAHVTVSDAEDPRLANCMRLRFASQSYGPGGAVELDTSWQFSLNQ